MRVGEKTLTTPAKVKLRRSGGPQSLRFDLAGHESWSGELIPVLDSGSMTMIVLETILLLIPGLVDIASGSAYDYPAKVTLELPARGSGIPIATFLRPIRPKPAPQYE